MDFAILVITGYLIGLVQGGIHIYTGQKPLDHKKKKSEPEYNEDYSHLMPQEYQDYLRNNNGQIK